MKLAALALSLGLAAMVGACAPTEVGSQRNSEDFNLDWVFYDDDSGEVQAVPVSLVPEITLVPIEGERGVIVMGTRNAKDILDDDVALPDEEGGLGHALMSEDDLAFFLASVSRWVDDDLLVAESEEGELREWAIE